MGGMERKRARRSPAPWLFLLFLAFILVGVAVTERAMNYMLGHKVFGAFVRVGVTSGGQINLILAGRRYNGPRVSWLARSVSRSSQGLSAGSRRPAGPAARPGKEKGWVAAVRRVLGEVIEIGRDVRRFFSAWQLDASLQDL